MAKGIKGSSLNEEKKPHKTTFIIDPQLMKKVKYVAFMEEREITSVVNESLKDFIAKYEKKNGEIPVK